jgi:hypothetical protein
MPTANFSPFHFALWQSLAFFLLLLPTFLARSESELKKMGGTKYRLGNKKSSVQFKGCCSRIKRQMDQWK